jgi:hypothetical protein
MSANFGAGFHVAPGRAVDASAYDRFIGRWSRLFVSPVLAEGDILGPSDAFRRKLGDFYTHRKADPRSADAAFGLETNYSRPHARQRLAGRWSEIAAGFGRHS